MGKTYAEAEKNNHGDIIEASERVDWARESMKLRKQVYDIGDGNLSYEYSYQNMDTVRKRLLGAGVRLAGLFNEIYG